jgi:DNA-binding LacI/PurR family transcriptional regulator
MRHKTPPDTAGLDMPNQRTSRATSYDVARLAGVSQSAVSRCFSQGASISDETRGKVQAAARTLGYSPNALARSLITRRSGLVGLIVTDATLRHSPQIIHDLGDALKQAQFMPLLSALRNESDLEYALPAVLDYQPEAIISLVTIEPALIKDAHARGVPVVLINRTTQRGLATSICCDQALGVKQLVAGLLENHHRQLAFIAGPKGAPVSEQRLKGYLNALSAAGLKPLDIVYADYTYEGGHAAALTLCKMHRKIDALVCANDAMAIGALDACVADLGLKVPEQISVTGFDDIPEGSRPIRSLTTVRQPTQEMAALAVTETLRLCRAAGEQRGQRHMIAGTLMLRATSKIRRA